MKPFDGITKRLDLALGNAEEEAHETAVALRNAASAVTAVAVLVGVVAVLVAVVTITKGVR